jgi:predicted HTH transcriptional regulator
MKCQSCGSTISVEESYVLNGRTLCEDCYLEEGHPVKACNPWAVHSAKQLQKQSGTRAEENLTDTQKAIYTFVKSKGKVTIRELVDNLNLSRTEIEKQLAILRHLELTKGKLEDKKTYIVPF